MKHFFQSKILLVLTGVVVCCALLLNCNDDSTSNLKDLKGVVYDWDWEVLDDSNQNKFGPGISILDPSCYTVHPTKFSQVFVLESQYVFGQPKTGWYLIDETGLYPKVTMQDSKGYDTTKLWPLSKQAGAPVPLKEPTLVKTKGPHGTEVDAIRLHGTLLQKGSEDPNRLKWVQRTGAQGDLTMDTPKTDYRFGCGWPAITLYAAPPDEKDQPNQETRLGLMDGYGYAFWVKPMLPYVVYRASVENWDYRPNEGMEPSHWFGTDTGRDATVGKNFTFAPVGEWTRVVVIYDAKNKSFNMVVPNWITMYGVMANFPEDQEPFDIAKNHNKDNSIRIVLAIPLQHNYGSEGTALEAYSVVEGKHNYDVYFYGLEILEY